MKHRLDPLLRPRSVAVVGASLRTDSMGKWLLTNLKRGGFPGNVYPVNLGYDELDGMKCYTSLQDLFCQLAAQFSWMVDALEEELCEVDINPVIVSGDHCITVDTLVIGELNEDA